MADDNRDELPEEFRLPEPEAPLEDEETRKKRHAALFGDLEDESEANITPDAEQLQAEVARLTGALMQSQAENAKLGEKISAGEQLRRVKEAEFAEETKFATAKLLKDMIPVVDTMEMGLSAITPQMRQDPKFAGLAQGMEKTLGQLMAVFNKHGIQQINPLNQPFDDKRHEVIATQNKDGVDSETVITVVQKGYELKGRLIRPAKVVVTPI